MGTMTDQERQALKRHNEREEARRQRSRTYMAEYRARKREALRASNRDLVQKL